MTAKSRVVAGSVVLFLLGSAFHFFYDLLGQHPFAAVFFSVNESVWEHMKSLFTAALVWMTVDWRLADGDNHPGFFAARAAALPAALLSVPMLFYFLQGALGIENVWVDIGLFLLAAILYQGTAVKLEKQCGTLSKGNLIGISVLVSLFLLFVLLTFFPPRLPLFMDVPTGTYGIPR